ncbi:hypothetical protein [Methylobacterium sp. Leaf456]|nr:hypothetical protein [Methylobacterium sp. Leaf456]
MTSDMTPPVADAYDVAVTAFRTTRTVFASNDIHEISVDLASGI